MAKNPYEKYEKPATHETADQEWLGSNIVANKSREPDVEDRLEIPDLKSILDPRTRPAASGRKPLFGR